MLLYMWRASRSLLGQVIIQILAFVRVIGTCGGLITRILRMIVPLAP